MALFDMVENFLSPVTLEIECPSTFYARQGAIEGQIKVTAQGAQQISEVVIILIERSRYSGESEEELVVGKTAVCSRPFTVAAGEEKRLDFSLDFSLPERGWDHIINEGGVLGALGKVVEFLDNGTESVSTSYDLIAAADVAGCKFDPKVTKWLSRVE